MSLCGDGCMLRALADDGAVIELLALLFGSPPDEKQCRISHVDMLSHIFGQNDRF